jgi:hypothetical protein
VRLRFANGTQLVGFKQLAQYSLQLLNLSLSEPITSAILLTASGSAIPR